MLRLLRNTKLFCTHMETDSPKFLTGLKVRNSLSGKLEDFVTTQGKSVRWYTCGPTVYSNSHLGHARNYICNDIVRRILTNYFKYDVTLMMNITDIDDKIINSSIEEKIEFTEFTKKWEKDFFEDMKNLKVELPDLITRVSEFLPEIIVFIQGIINNGYAYESNGSVYFETQKYRNKFGPGKLKRIETAETEAEEVFSEEKKAKEDFALWKKTKIEGEPFWESPWGNGRPGWHIECSAMASHLFGEQMDIHSGGIDLIFPHHENEICQSEAYFNKPDWVRYFIHVGHLEIDGLKMSKSLKNFITIKEMLKVTTPRVVRMFFAMHQYNKVLNFSRTNSLLESTAKDKSFKDFFSLLRTLLREIKIDVPQKWEDKDHNLFKEFSKMKANIHIHLCNNFDTGKVFDEIDEFVKLVNTYAYGNNPKQLLIKSIYDYLIGIFDLFGLDYAAQETAASPNDRAIQIMNTFVKFRDDIRSNAKTDFKNILEICDRVRDQDLVELNIRIEDKKIGEPSLWKEEKKQILIKEREDKIAAKQALILAKKAEEEDKIAKMKINPRDMFKNKEEYPTYSQFDEEGIPTHKKGDKDKEDKEIIGKDKASLVKKWNAQKELYEKYLSGQTENEKGKEEK